jgi:predicted unusual protein kinase regulating ubiquinone biosynthesis (AarF/ABC1/UbiB family)
MDRRRERWATFARAQARRFLVGAKRLLTTDPDARGEGDAAEAAAAEELARSAGELRGGMAKMAQLMAYLRGPGGAGDDDARRVLGALWDRAPGADPQVIRRVVEEDLGAPPEAIFATWDDAPIAAASLGQVHAATARDGARLAVKVQYPGVAEGLRSDLESPRLLRALAGAKLGAAVGPESIDRLRDAVLAELDYVAEGRWLERFRRAFIGTRDIHIPRLHAATSSRRVLSVEHVDGRPLIDASVDAPEELRARVGLALFRFAWGGPLRHRLLNADPNPGNYLVLPDGRTAFVDFGCAVELDEDIVAQDRRLWRAVLAGDGETLRHAVHSEGLVPRERARALDASNFREWERYLAAPHLTRGSFHWTAGYARRFAELTSELVRAGGMVLPPAAILLWRQRLGVAAVLGELSPKADFAGELQQILRECD